MGFVMFLHNFTNRINSFNCRGQSKLIFNLIKSKLFAVVGAIGAIIAILLYGKAKKHEGKSEQIKDEKAEAYDETTKDAQHVAKHATDDIDTLSKRLRPYTRHDA